MTNRKNNKKGDNTLLVALLGLLGIGGSIGLVAWARARTSDPSSPSNGNKEPKSLTLSEVAAKLRAELVTLDGCSVAWKVGEASRTVLLAHQSDFFIPAIADARSKGLTSTDEITSHVAGLLVPGCPWPPTIIQDLDIEAAVAGQLPFVQNQMWTIAQALGSVQLYLTIRSSVATSLTTNRRG